jgi:hypothetical protein
MNVTLLFKILATACCDIVSNNTPHEEWIFLVEEHKTYLSYSTMKQKYVGNMHCTSFH